MSPATYWFAGAPRIPGTGIPRNVMGDCGHRHRSPEAAQACIDAVDRAFKRRDGMRNCSCDRVVMVCEGGYNVSVWSDGAE